MNFKKSRYEDFINQLKEQIPKNTKNNLEKLYVEVPHLTLAEKSKLKFLRYYLDDLIISF